MTIEESIDQLQDLKKDRESFICSDTEPDSPFRYDIEAIDVAIKTHNDLMRENAELKRLLKLAVEHMRMLADSIRNQEDECSCCGLCAYDGDFSTGESGDFFSECPGFESDECFVWKHADEARGVIENGNEMDSVQ